MIKSKSTVCDGCYEKHISLPTEEIIKQLIAITVDKEKINRYWG